MGTIPSKVLIVSQAREQIVVATETSDFLKVKLESEDGSPIPFFPIYWTVESEGGVLASYETKTALDGTAQNKFIAGTKSGNEKILIKAFQFNVESEIALELLPGAPTSIEVYSGDEQIVTVASVLGTTPGSEPLQVIVKDEYGNPVPGVSVSWSLTSGTGTLSPSSTTDSAGLAFTPLTMGTEVGTTQVVATLGDFSSEEFTTTAIPDQPFSLAHASLSHQTATVGQNLSSEHTVLISDQYGNPVPNTSVLWAVSQGNGFVGGGTDTSESSLTDAEGKATQTHRLGTLAGDQAVTASLPAHPSVASVLFSATAQPDVPTQFSRISSNPQTGVVGEFLGTDLSVLVSDQYGNPVPDVSVRWEVTQGSGYVGSGTNTVETTDTNANGNAVKAYRLGTVAGSSHGVTASLPDFPAISSLTFSANANPGPLAEIEIESGDSQVSFVSGTLADPIVVKTVDSYANPISGVSVNWSITNGSNATLSAASSSSDANGLAQVSVTALGSNNVINQITATSGALSRILYAFGFEDAQNIAYGFSGGTHSGTSYQGSAISLLQSTGCASEAFCLEAELASSRTPSYGDLVAYWKFSGMGAIANNATISATVGPDATAINTNGTGLAYTPGRANSGIVFDGTDVLNLGTSTAFDFGTTTNFSISVWAKWTSTAYGRIFSNGHTSYSNGWMLTLNPGDNPGGVLFGIGVGNSAINSTHAYSTSDYNDGNWHHLVAVFKRSAAPRTQTLYIDGQTVAIAKSAGTCGSVSGNSLDIGSCTSATANRSAPNVTIGGYSSTQERLNASIDELAIWDVALTASDVQSIYNSQKKTAGEFTSRVFGELPSGYDFSALEWRTNLPYHKELPDQESSESTSDYPDASPDLMDGIVALFHLNENTANNAPGGTDYEDQSGNGLHADIMGGVTMGQPGKFNLAPTFNGINGYVNLSNVSQVATPNYTISLWFKTTATKDHYMYSYRLYGKMLRMTNGIVSHTNNDSAANNRSAVTTQSYADGTWHHAVGTYNDTGRVVRLYMDGNTPITASGFPNDIYYGTVSPTATIGSDGGVTGFFNGQIDEVAIWDRALSDSEVQQVYLRGANRILFQARMCTASDCSDAPAWSGPDGTNGTYFSELYNNSSVVAGTAVGEVLPNTISLLFDEFPGFSGTQTQRNYFQYKAFLQSEGSSSFPQLNNVRVIPNRPPPSF